MFVSAVRVVSALLALSAARVVHWPTVIPITNALIRSMKNPQTSGTMMKARCAAPYYFATAVMFTIAVAVEPRAMPPKPALMTAAS